MTEPLAETVSAADVAKLRTELDELRQAYTDLREASTAKEKEAAREDVKDARADLDALASRLGISRDALETATAEARKAERRAELSPIVDELIEEKLSKLAEEDDDDDKPDDDKVAAVKDDKPAKPVKAEKPAADDGPVTTHWSDKRVTELLR